MEEQVTVNYWVVGSSPTRGVPPFYDNLPRLAQNPLILVTRTWGGFLFLLKKKKILD